MIRAIAAIDRRRGIATDDGIPWKLAADQHYFRDKTNGVILLIGYRTYQAFTQPLPGRQNFVITHSEQPLRPGFSAVVDYQSFLKRQTDDVWVIGGAQVYQQTLSLVSELYITQINGDFNCTKFFPDFTADFQLLSRSPLQSEGTINYHFEVYARLIK